MSYIRFIRYYNDQNGDTEKLKIVRNSFFEESSFAN